MERALSLPGVLNIADLAGAIYAIGKRRRIIHLHVTHLSQIGWPMLRWLGSVGPTAWTLHDMWPLTGNCIYPIECTKWQTICHKCPQVDLYPRLRHDTTYILHRLKKRLLRSIKPALIAPSHYILRSAEKVADKLNADVTYIPHAVECNVFKPQNKKLARARLRLPVDDLIVFCPWPRWDDPRKGGHLLYPLARALDASGVSSTLIVLNHPGCATESGFKNVKLRNFPMAQADSEMVDYYGVSDVTVSFSLIEAFGRCIAESHACGRAVVAFDAPGIDELINKPILGKLVEREDWHSFIEALILYKNEGECAIEKRRLVAEERYDPFRWAKRHVRLFEKMRRKDAIRK